MPRSGKQGTPSSSETVDLANNEPFITNIYIHFNIRTIAMENIAITVWFLELLHSNCKRVYYHLVSPFLRVWNQF